MFRWKKLYETEIAEIDKQHKKLLEIGAKLFEEIKLGDSVDHYDEIVNIIGELKNYTIYHFEYEEKMMEKYGYEGLDEHKKKHRIFVDKIVQLEKEELDEKQNMITQEMLMFVADWIEKHILGTDHKYKDFLHQKGVS